MKMFIQICLALLLGILLRFNRCGQASNFGSEGKYFSKAERLLEANEKYHKALKYDKDILSSTFNVKDFGAKGDKTTDDTKVQ